MAGDYTRFTDKPRKRYSGVLMQQGRVQLDADWNEQTEIIKRRWQTQAIDTFGHCAVPKDINPNAFKVTPTGATNFTLGEGRIYVEGLIAEILAGENFTYLNQPFYPAPPALPASGNAIVYLDVWEREVTYIEDPEILEKALGGPDTATRTQTVWQVKVHWTGANPAQCKTDLNALFPPSGGRLTTQAIAPPASDDPCIISPSGGYRGLENRLYRVEIHTKGDLATAKFKWSRENASVVAEVRGISTPVGSPSTLTVTRIGRDKVLRFQPNDWVEVLDDNRELMGQAGIMAKIASLDESNLTITLDRAIPAGVFNTAAVPSRHTRLRRWDQRQGVDADGLLTVSNAFMDLEDGIQVRFDLDTPATKRFEVSDYWVFAARTADGSVEPLNTAPPRGIIHNYCQLAALSGLGTTTVNPQDCRPLWPQDIGGCCCCTITVGTHGKEVGDFPDLPSAIAALANLTIDEEAIAEICLLPGDYHLTGTVVITRDNTTIKGCGWGQTNVTAPGVVFSVDAVNVTLEGMEIRALGQGPGQSVIEITGNGDDCRIERNLLVGPDNAIQTLNDVNNLKIVENDVNAPNSVKVGGTNILVAGNKMASTLKINVGSHRVWIEKNKWSGQYGQGANVIDSAAIMLGANQEAVTPRTISEIDIIDNHIEFTKGSAIVSGRFNSNGRNESQALGLRIIGNRIVNCVWEFAVRGENDPPFGGIILAGAEHLVIRDNRIENNGVRASVPVCGIFVRHSRGMEISGNRILNNGRPADDMKITGLQGGIVAMGAAIAFEKMPSKTGDETDGNTIFVDSPGSYSSMPQYDGFPAALIADNIVSAPRGLALCLVGIGPMLVHGNHFSSLHLTRNKQKGLRGLDGVVGAVLIMNFGMPSYFYSSLAAAGFLAHRKYVRLTRGGSRRFVIGGKIQFVDNQVMLNLSQRGAEYGIAAMMLLSMDDINASNNQVECILPDDGIIFDLLSVGVTTRQSGNGFMETPIRCGFSMLSLGFAMNTSTDNQGTHCIEAVGAKLVEKDNLVLLPNPIICPESKGFRLFYSSDPLVGGKVGDDG